MKTTAFFIAALFLRSSLHAQVITTKALKDSIERRYVTNGAERFSYFAPEWQIYLDSALAITPDNAALWELKSMPYDKSRKYEIGEKYLNKAVELDPKEYLGLRAFQKCIFYKRFSDALIDYDAAEKLRGNFTMMEHPFSFYKAICRLGLNEFDSALYELDRTIALEKTTGGDRYIHFMDWFYRGMAFMELGRYADAVADLDNVLARYHNFSDAQYYKAKCLFRLGKKEEAPALMDEAADNFKKGYSFTEDNAIYERYLYQLCPYQVQYIGTKNK